MDKMITYRKLRMNGVPYTPYNKEMPPASPYGGSPDSEAEASWRRKEAEQEREKEKKEKEKEKK